MRRAILPLLLLSSLSVVGFRAEDTYSLVHKHTLGETQTVAMKVEGKFSEFALTSEVVLTQKVTELAEDGAYTIEVTSSDEKTVVNGEEVPQDADEPKTKTQKYDAKGDLIREDGEEEDEKGPMDVAFEYEPKSPVKIGETWTPEKKEDEPQPIEWTLVGKEDLDGKEALVIEGKGKGPDDETIESKVWVDAVTFVARKATSSIHGIKQEEGGDGEMTISIQEKL